LEYEKKMVGIPSPKYSSALIQRGNNSYQGYSLDAMMVKLISIIHVNLIP